MNIFSFVLYVFAVIALIATGAYPKNRKESLTTAVVFVIMGTVLLFV